MSDISIVLVIDEDAFIFNSFEKFEEARKNYEKQNSLESITGYVFK